VFKESIRSSWEKLKVQGVESNHLLENAIISVINQMGFIGGIACMIMVVISWAIGASQLYTIMCFILGVTILLIPILNSYQKVHISKLIIGAVHPSLVNVYIVVTGGAIGEESMLTVSLFMIFILFQKKPKMMRRLYLLGASTYLLAQLYIFVFPPIFNIVDNPFDNFMSFSVCVVWILMILWLYKGQLTLQQRKQMKLINELQDKNANLKKTTEELEQFTYIASHDLKSPLRTIISFLDLIKRDVKRERYDDLLSKLDFARSGAEHMNYLVTDILEYSKITSGTQRKKQMISLQSLADKVRFNLTELIQKKNVDLYVFPLPDFYCNETEMTVLFQNFIENGIKYNEEATPNIFVKSKIDTAYLTLQFIDNGIGIEEEYFSKIFLFFKRLHTNERYKGTGLGLGLCKKIIDDMGGTIEVESTINVGSTFTIKIPVTHPADVEASMALAEA